METVKYYIQGAIFWTHWTLVILGVVFVAQVSVTAYREAFPGDKEKEAQAVSMLLNKTADRAEGVLSGRK